MAGNLAWWFAALGVVMLLLAFRQVALAVVVVCATYGAVQHGIIDASLSLPRGLAEPVAAHQATAAERGRRFACERRALTALSHDNARALALVHRDCGDVFTKAAPSD
jgi:hypothetical protein